MMELLSSPFDEVTLGAISLATGLAQHAWGQRVSQLCVESKQCFCDCTSFDPIFLFAVFLLAQM